MNKTFFTINAEGTPFEIGYAHGSLGKEYIARSIDCYKAMFYDYSGITWDKAKAFSLTFIPTIEKYDPDIMAEIRGIAEGSGFELGEILALNTRSEIVLQSGQIDSALMDGCSALGFTPAKTEDGCAWIGQDWDWKHEAGEALILLRIKRSGKPNILMITEAGIVGKIGMNSCGIGVCLNALGSDKQYQGETIPLHIALRGVLDSRSLSEAIGNAGRFPLACCANFLIGSSTGQIITVEIGPGDIDVIYAEKGYVIHTNHFYGPRMVNIRDTGRISFPDSYLRLGRLGDMIRERADKKISYSDIREMLSDHVGRPDSICRHPDLNDPEEMRIETLFSVIMNLSEGKMYYTPGNPCSGEYLPVSVSE